MRRVGGPDAFDEDVHGCGVTESQAGAVDLTKARSAAGNFCDERGLTETQLPKALAKVVVTLDFTNASRGSRRELTQRRQMWAWRRHVID
jgi:hypothetical protein